MEILAPAGSIAALKAAIKAGANAVYLGLGEHNARVKSTDFTTDNLSEWVSYAHLFDVKVYVTLNTAVKSEEFTRVITLAKCAVESGADALIISDLGLVRALSEISDIPLHLSTQAGVQNSFDVRALKGLRLKRVILSRETPLTELKEIVKQVEEVEVFVQGAMCVSFSGGCLLGSKIYGLSGNRGVCNQACRLTYTAYDEKGESRLRGKLLSPYDLSLGEKVKELEKSGVVSIKIEGRLKRPAYVYAATKFYRDLLDGKDTKNDLEELKVHFNRGFTSGYTLEKSRKIVNIRTSAHIGIPVGKIVKVEDRHGFKYAHVISDHSFRKGDGAKIMRDGEEVGGSDVTSVTLSKGAQIIPVSDDVRVRDEVCLTTDIEKVEAAERVVNKLPIEITLEGAVGQPLVVTARCGEITASLPSEQIAQASTASNNRAIAEKLSKMGATDFTVATYTDLTKEPLFVGVSEINRIRREVVDSLRSALISAHTAGYTIDIGKYTPQSRPTDLGDAVLLEVSTVEDVNGINADRVVITPARYDKKTIDEILSASLEKKVYLRLPRIVRERELAYYQTLLAGYPTLGVFADSLFAVEIARFLGRGYIAGFGLNIFNEETASFFSDADLACASVEHPFVGEVVYRAGKLPLMSFAHCPFSVVYGTACASCDRARSVLYYSDGDHRFAIHRREGASCDFTMYEDAVTRYPSLDRKTGRFYSMIGLNEREKKEMKKLISEDKGE